MPVRDTIAFGLRARLKPSVFIRERVGHWIPCVIVTHRIAGSREFGDRVCVICRGKKEWEGKPEDVPTCTCRDRVRDKRF